MRAVVQRVLRGSVTVKGETISEIGQGIVVLLGVGQEDKEDDAQSLAGKIVNLRIFEDKEEKMNLSLKDKGGEILAVSQFTLYGDCRKGRRPSFVEAAPPAEADKLYQCFVNELKNQGIKVSTGIFQEHMLVNIQNDGPVTILLDSRKLF